MREDVTKAESFAREQRMANFKLLRLDASKDGTGGGAKLLETAQGDPLKFDGLLGDPKVGKLFGCGALRFGGR